MKYLIIPLKKFKEDFYPEMVMAQKEIYPDEPRVQPEDSEPYEDNSMVVAALDDDTLAGFCAFSICKKARNCDFFGSNLYFYVKPEYRNSLVAGTLIKYTENIAFTRGCKEFEWEVSLNSPLVETFDKRKEYKKESIIYSKSLI